MKLSRVAPNEWEFVYPRIYYDLMDEFHAGCELYEEMALIVFVPVGYPAEGP